MAAAWHIYACRVLQRLIECCGAATSDLVDILLQPGTCRIKPDKSQWFMNLHLYTMVYPKSGWFLIGPTWLITRGCLLLGSLRWYPLISQFQMMSYHQVSLHSQICQDLKFRYISGPQVVTILWPDRHRRRWSTSALGQGPLQQQCSHLRRSKAWRHSLKHEGKKLQIWWLISFCLAFRFLGLYRYTVYRYTQFSDMLTIAGDHSSQYIGAYHDKYDNPWVGKT